MDIFIEIFKLIFLSCKNKNIVVIRSIILILCGMKFKWYFNVFVEVRVIGFDGKDMLYLE